MPDRQKLRTLWISDIHLGTRGCNAEFLIDFLRHHESENLYLVGDIIDGWALKKRWFWKREFDEVIGLILERAQAGTNVVYVPGNHDEFLRDYVDLELAGVRVLQNTIHETADGRRLLVMHGDEFDSVIRYAPWLAKLGDMAYDLLLWINRHYNGLRRRLGLRYWSLSAYLKNHVKNAVSFISAFEHCLAQEARRREVDGVVCGHIHRAEMREIEGVLYCNDGDWVESCTALAEDWTGSLHLIEWTEVRGEEPLVTETRRSFAQPAMAGAPARDLVGAGA